MNLGLYDNQLSGPIPAELGNLTSLNHFWLHTNQLTGLVPLSVAGLGGELQQIAFDRCRFESNPGLFMTDSQDYMDADLNGDDSICGVELITPPPEDIADSLEDQIETLEDSESLNGGQGNSLTRTLDRIEAFIEGGRTAQAIRLLNAFIEQLNGLVASGALSESEGQALMEQADLLSQEL